MVLFALMLLPLRYCPHLPLHFRKSKFWSAEVAWETMPGVGAQKWPFLPAGMLGPGQPGAHTALACACRTLQNIFRSWNPEDSLAQTVVLGDEVHQPHICNGHLHSSQIKGTGLALPSMDLLCSIAFLV